jgi:OmcA/MtrC family decaheme c-type cytochrome
MKARISLAAAFSIAALALVTGCKGDTGPVGPAGPGGDAGPPGNPAVTLITIPGNDQTPTAEESAAWAALAPKVTVQSVTISSPPKVTFKVTDANGIPIAGLGNRNKAPDRSGNTPTVPGLTNLAFAMAKLVPVDNGAPSHWVSYMVTTVPSTRPDGGTVATGPSTPTTDNVGTLVDNGDGTYVYTFFRDVPGTKAQVDAMSFTGAQKKEDLGDLTYEPTKVHRLTIVLYGNAPGTGSNTPTGVTNVPAVPMQKPVDAIYDFVPSTGPVTTSGRDMVTTENCDTCHQVLGGIPGDNPEASGAGFHGGSRNEVRYCSVCHTEQRKFGTTEATIDGGTLTFTSSTSRVYDRAVGNLPNFIHHTHAGPVLALKNYNYGGVHFNEVLYPQDLRNCTKCHNPDNPATPQADNFKKYPNRVACGGCHDGIDFATGKGVTLADAMQGKTVSPEGHVGGIQPDDTKCAGCHSDPNRPDINVDAVHRPVTPPNDDNALAAHPDGGAGNNNTNAAWIASNPARLPAGAIAVSYDLKSIALDNAKHPKVVFRLLQNGVRTDLNDAGTSTEIWNNFMGSPSFQFVYSVPQDGITTPSDFNVMPSAYLRTVWAGKGGSLSGPDSDGYYTATLTTITIPDAGVMLTGGIGYSYGLTSTLPLTQTNLDKYPVSAPTAANTTDGGVLDCANPALTANPQNPKCAMGGLIVIAPHVGKVATGFTGRRAIVEDKRCNACHQELGTFTEDAFHAGQRNDGTTCAYCHFPNRASSGWSVDSTYFIHAIHAGAKRDVEFTYHAESPTSSFKEVAYPGVLNFCEGCHIPGAYNFANADSEAQLPFRLYRTVATGTFSGKVGDTVTQYSGSDCTTTKQSAPASALTVHQLPGEGGVQPVYFQATANQTSSPEYGIGFSINTGTSASSGCTPDGTPYTLAPGQSVENVSATKTSYAKNLVNSPVAGVCFACHDTTAAMAHFDLNGGSIYKKRGTADGAIAGALTTVETCMICHGPGRIADIQEVHSH